MNYLYFENFDFSLANVKLLADVAEIQKDEEGHIGIAIGGGAPYCPCLYVVQIYDESPVAKDGRICLGDEIFAINGQTIKGFCKSTVAKLIHQSLSPIKISFNKLNIETNQGQTFDIALKKFKHWFVESIDEKTADALGLSRAVSCNDLLAQLTDKLEINTQFYKTLIKICKNIIKNYQHLAIVEDNFGSIFCEIAVRELIKENQDYFTAVGEFHKNFKKEHLILVGKIQTVIEKLQIYVEKAIPDTKASIKKYLDAKFDYFAFCLKAKELEDEEVIMLEENEYLKRMENGNYEYRIILRCRERSRQNFMAIRKHVMVKIELLDEKHVRELALYLRTLMDALKITHENCRNIIYSKFTADMNQIKNSLEQCNEINAELFPQIELIDFNKL